MSIAVRSASTIPLLEIVPPFNSLTLRKLLLLALDGSFGGGARKSSHSVLRPLLPLLFCTVFDRTRQLPTGSRVVVSRIWDAALQLVQTNRDAVLPEAVVSRLQQLS